MFAPLTPEEAVARLQPMLGLLHKSIEAGVDEARTYFLDRRRAVDPFLAPAIFRYAAKGVLKGGGIPAEEEPASVSVDDLANNGIQFSFGGIRIRVRKASNGRLPGTGGSSRLQEYYQQVLPLGGTDRTADVNLMVLWDATVPKFILCPDLWLVCPAGGTDSVGEAHWAALLPHPAEVERSTPPAASSESLGDLDITPRRREDTMGQRGG